MPGNVKIKMDHILVNFFIKNYFSTIQVLVYALKMSLRFTEGVDGDDASLKSATKLTCSFASVAAAAIALARFSSSFDLNMS